MTTGSVHGEGLQKLQRHRYMCASNTAPPKRDSCPVAESFESGSAGVYNRRCRARQRAVKQMSIARLPPVLAMHVKRFEAGGTHSQVNSVLYIHLLLIHTKEHSQCNIA